MAYDSEKESDRRRYQRRRLEKLGLPVPPELDRRVRGSKPKAAKPKPKPEPKPKPRRRFVPSAPKSPKLLRIRRLLADDESTRDRHRQRADAVATIESLVASGDVALLASAEHFADAARVLQDRLSPHNTGAIGILLAGEGLPWKLATAFGLVRQRWQVWSPAKVLRLTRDAKGPKGETVRALLSGSGEPAAAVLLRRIIEARRGFPLPVYDFDAGSQ